MSLGKHLDEAAKRLEEASFRIDEARAKGASPEGLREWLAALTDYAMALNDVHLLNNESIHEKIHALAEQVRVKV